MTIELPYMNAYGNIHKVFDKIISAQTPPKFTQDFLKSVLGVKSSSAQPIIPFMKRLGMLASDGAPTNLYTQFRSDSKRGAAAAIALRNGYSPLFESNEYAFRLDDNELLDLVIQITGLKRESKSAKAIVSSFKAVNEFADFDSDMRPLEQTDESINSEIQEASTPSNASINANTKLGLSYTINLNLPATSDIAVFDAIFKSLKENILK